MPATEIVAVAELLELGDGHRAVAALGHAQLGRVLGDREGLLGRLAAFATRQQAPAKGEEDDRHGRERQADGDEVEQLERRPAELLAHRRDEQVRRGADLGDRAADERGEGKRHQVDRARLVAAPRRLDRDRHEDAERADVLDERRQVADRRRHHADLQRRRADALEHGSDRQLEDARRCDGAAHHEHRGDDDDHRVREAVERLGGRHDAEQHGDEQHQRGDDVVAQAPAHEEGEHRRDERERLDLVKCHARSVDGGGPHRHFPCRAGGRSSRECLSRDARRPWNDRRKIEGRDEHSVTLEKQLAASQRRRPS